MLLCRIDTSAWGSKLPSAVQQAYQVSVTTIPGRVGQRVRNELLFQTTTGRSATDIVNVSKEGKEAYVEVMTTQAAASREELLEQIDAATREKELLQRYYRGGATGMWSAEGPGGRGLGSGVLGLGSRVWGKPSDTATRRHGEKIDWMIERLGDLAN